MKYGILLISLFFFLGISFGRIEFSLVDEITLDGDNFGNGGEYDYVCFNDEKSCYHHTSASIKSWTNRKITLSPLSDIPSRGVIIVYHQGEETKFGYVLKPFITGIHNEYGRIVDNICFGDVIYISGLGLSNSNAYVWNESGRGKKKVSIDSIEIASKDFVESIGYPNLYGTLQYAKIDTSDIDSKIKAVYLEHSGLESASYNIKVLNNVTDDPFSCMQHYLYNIKYDENEKLFPNKGGGITVAIIDDGLNHNHSDLKHSLHINADEVPNNGLDDDNNGYVDDVHGWNFSFDKYVMDDFGGHGTLVAGIIASKSNNGIGIGGIADEAKLMTLIVDVDDGSAGDQISDAIVYATDNGANIINLSIGSVFNSTYNESLDNAIKYANNNNVIIVAASGNGDYTKSQARDLDIYPSSPVCNDLGKNMVSGVTSIDFYNAKSSFADYGDKCVDYALPGENIVSTSHPGFSENGMEYEIVDGTSFSAPILSAIYALVWSNNIELSANGVKEMVLDMSFSTDYSSKEKIGNYIDLGLYAMLDATNYNITPVGIVSEPFQGEEEVLQENTNIETVKKPSEVDDDQVVEWMYLNGLTKYKYEDFNPNGLITREQTAKFLTVFGEMIGLIEGAESVCEFSDITTADYTLLPYIYESCKLGLLKGSKSKFYPFKNMSYIESLTVAVRSIYGLQDESTTPRYKKYYELGTKNIYSFSLDRVDESISRIEFGRMLYNSYYISNQ